MKRYREDIPNMMKEFMGEEKYIYSSNKLITSMKLLYATDCFKGDLGTERLENLGVKIPKDKPKLLQGKYLYCYEYDYGDSLGLDWLFDEENVEEPIIHIESRVIDCEKDTVDNIKINSFLKGFTNYSPDLIIIRLYVFTNQAKMVLDETNKEYIKGLKKYNKRIKEYLFNISNITDFNKKNIMEFTQNLNKELFRAFPNDVKKEILKNLNVNNNKLNRELGKQMANHIEKYLNILDVKEYYLYSGWYKGIILMLNRKNLRIQVLKLNFKLSDSSYFENNYKGLDGLSYKCANIDAMEMKSRIRLGQIAKENILIAFLKLEFYQELKPEFLL